MKPRKILEIRAIPGSNVIEIDYNQYEISEGFVQQLITDLANKESLVLVSGGLHRIK